MRLPNVPVLLLSVVALVAVPAGARAACPVLEITSPASFPAGTSGTLYPAQSLVVTGAAAPVVWTASPLPAGLSVVGATLSGTPTATGTFVVRLVATDTNGCAASRTQPMTIGSNQPPVVTGTTFSLAENSANATVVGTVSATDPDAGQTLTWSITAGNTGGAFAINASSGQITVATSSALNFETTPSFSLTVQAADDGTPILSGSATVTVNLTDVNEPPVVSGESYQTISNTLLEVAPASVVTAPRVFVVGNLLSNDTDPDAAATLSTSLNAATAGAVVSVAANGTFTYLPPAGLTGSDSFTYNVFDGANTVSGTVSISFAGRLWYVKNDATAGGLGRSADPFDTLAEAGVASAVGDTIYVFAGDGTTTGQDAGIALKGNQRLLGEAVALSMPVSVNGGPNPTPLRAAGARPQVGNTGGNGVGVTDVTGVEIRGLSLSGSANGLDVTLTGGFATTGTITVVDNVVSSAGAEGIDVNLAGTGTTTLVFASNALSSTGDGLDIVRTAGTGVLSLDSTTVTAGANGFDIDGGGFGSFTITSFLDNVLSGNLLGTGAVIANATFDATPGGAIQAVAGGDLGIGSTGNGVGASGLVLTNVQGNLGFATDLDIEASAGTALQASGAGSGLSLSVPAGVATLVSTAGPAANLSAVAVDLQLQSLASSNSATGGVSLTNVTGTFSASAGSSITNATGTDFLISGGTANVTYNGTITDDVGQLVSVAGATAGTKIFAGAITDGGDGDGSGISLSGNTGATIRFNGGLVLSTGANAAFAATGGGTVEICDEAGCNPAATGGLVNTIATTTATALNVANTTLGAGGLELRSVSVLSPGGAPANGIVLNTTGATGSLKVKGTGSAGSGGTIQGTSGDGISLTSTLAPSFDRMIIQNTAGNGLRGTAVNGFTLTNSTVQGSGTSGTVSNLAFNTSTVGNETNLSGVVTITGNTLNTAFQHGIDIVNFAGTITSATIGSNTITSSTSTATSTGSAIRLLANGSAATAANVTAATISGNIITNFPTGSGIVVLGGNPIAGGPSVTFGTPGSGTNVIAITGNRVAGQSGANRLGGNAIEARLLGTGQANFDISSNGTVANPIANIAGIGILHAVLGPGTATATVSGNVLVTNSTAANPGVWAMVDSHFGLTDAGQLTTTISNNQVSQSDGNGILAVARNSAGTLRAKIQSNTVAAPLTGVRPGIRVDSGNASGNTAVCLNISGNTSAGSGGSQGLGLRKQGTVTTTNAFGVNGMAATASPGVESYVDGLNPAGGGTLLISATSGFSNCSLP